MRFLTDAERQHLQEHLERHGTEHAPPDPRGAECDCALVFEALHVLADGIPERLYAVLHPASTHGLHRTREWDANAGRTLLWIQAVAERGTAACDE